MSKMLEVKLIETISLGSGERRGWADHNFPKYPNHVLEGSFQHNRDVGTTFGPEHVGSCCLQNMTKAPFPTFSIRTCISYVIRDPALIMFS